MYIYQEIRNLRVENKLSQQKVADVLKITRQQYQLYESGKREMPMHIFIKLAKFYDVSLDYLAGLNCQK